MSTKRTYFSLILGLTMTGQEIGSAGPWPHSPAERAQVFATCAGRLSALIEHERTLVGTTSEHVEAQRGTFQALLNAVMPDALDYGLPESQAMDWLLHAKLSQSRLLMRADFYTDALVKQKARDAADAFLQECDRFLLS